MSELSRTNYAELVVDMVNIHEAKTHLSRLLERVEAGERIVIARAGRPIADLVPHQQKGVTLGRWAGQIEYDSDTFDDPDPEIIAMFAGDDDSAR